MLDLVAELRDLIRRVAGLLAEQLDVVGLILGHVVEQADRIDLQISQGLGVLVHADDKTLRLHRDRGDVTTNIQVTLSVSRGG